MGSSSNMRAHRFALTSIIALLLLARTEATSAETAPARESVLVVRREGDVTSRAPGEEHYQRVPANASLPDGARLRVGEDGEATIRFADGTESTIRARSEVAIRAVRDREPRPNAVILFFGRVWSEVVKASGGTVCFEVRSANAVAGVRGTKFEAGTADDGATRVIVREGTVSVGGDAGGDSSVTAGSEIEVTREGRLLERVRTLESAAWEKWFAERGHAIEREGGRIAGSLEARLEKKRAELERLRSERAELAEKGEGVEKIDAAIDDLARSLRAAFGMVERWGALAERGAFEGREELRQIAARVAKLEARLELDREREHASPRGRLREERRLPKERERRRR
jgi:FecR-like protein